MDAALAFGISGGLYMDKAQWSHEIEELEAQITGTEVTSIDDKGRVRLPKKMQDALGNPFVLFVHPSGCITAYPVHRWNSLVRAVRALPEWSEQHQKAMGYLGENSMPISADAQGRFVVSRPFRDLAGLKSNDIMVIGCIDYLEIWSPADRQTYLANPESVARGNSKKIFQEVVELARGR